MQKTKRKRYLLRKEAEAQVARNPPTIIVSKDAEKLLHELRVHQVQLEMQNESLQQAQTLLAESHERYVELYDASPVGYLTLTPEGTISQVNPKCADLLKRPREKLLKRPLRSFVPPEYLERINGLVSGAAEKDESTLAELMLKRADGSFFHAELVCRRKIPPHGPPVLHVAVSDISERKRVEQQLRIAATAFESQEGMFIMNAERVILRVNSAFTRITGYSASAAVGQPMNLLNSSCHDATFYAAMWEVAACSGSWQGEIWSRRQNGEIFNGWLTLTAVRGDGETITHYVGTLTDNTLRKAEEERVKHLAFYDSLTQLPNRQLLLNRLQQALAASIRSGREGALLFIDLDNFKRLNDTLGHSMGDLLLQQVAQRLTTCIREGDTVARLGGDEFVIMLEDLSENLQEAAEQIEAVGEKVLVTLNRLYDLDGHEYHSTPSIGATLFHNYKDNVTELLKSADLAMYNAKSAGRNVLRFFDPKMQAVVSARVHLEADLRNALCKEQFVLYYQAQVDGDENLTGAEALLRWQHPVRGLLCPPEFLSLAEQTGLIVPLGCWVLETACRQLAAWSLATDTAHLGIAVNISSHEAHQPEFIKNVLSTLERTGANPHKLRLELTESLLGRDFEETAAKMATLKAVGVGFALDNFGQGSSSLSALKRLPLDQLKIGNPFVHNILSEPNDAAMARSIVALARSLGLSVISEGIETAGQRDFFKSVGCQAYQGNFFGAPVPIEALI
jgi:diguanylate cyclase (GGDEF)-like protein/PAS domain S-box-containing protein